MGQGKKTIIKTISLFLVAFLVLSATTGQAYAYRLKDFLKSIVGNNNIIFWNRNEKKWKDKNGEEDEDDNGDCVTNGDVAGSGDLADIYNAKNAGKQYTDIGSARWGDGNTAQMARVLEGYGDLAYRLGKAVGAPWVAILVQMRYEDPESVCGKNNFWGNGCPPGTGPGGAKIQGRNLGEGFVQYGKTLTNGMHNQALGITNPKTYLEKIGPTWVQGNINGKGYGQIEGMKKSVDSLVAFIESPEGQAIVSQFGTFTSSEDLGICDNNDDNPDDDDEDDNDDDDEEYEDVELVSGGMNLSQAKSFVKYYADKAREMQGKANFSWEGTEFTGVGCTNGGMSNCTAFTAWFLNKYTSASGVPLKQGSQFVDFLTTGKYKNEFSKKTKVPSVYSVMSAGPRTGTKDGWSNHTAIVLGIDKQRNKIILGEATCHGWKGVSGSEKFTPRAKEYNLSTYTNNPSSYGPVYTTPKVIKGL